MVIIACQFSGQAPRTMLSLVLDTSKPLYQDEQPSVRSKFFAGAYTQFFLEPSAQYYDSGVIMWLFRPDNCPRKIPTVLFVREVF